MLAGDRVRDRDGEVKQLRDLRFDGLLAIGSQIVLVELDDVVVLHPMARREAVLLIPDGLGNSARPDVPGRPLQRRQSIQQPADDRTRPEALLKRHDVAADRGVSQCLRPVVRWSMGAPISHSSGCHESGGSEHATHVLTLGPRW